MATILEFRSYVRFALSQLGAQNKHHEFEALAREFARARICSNILPATGPVSAGGDGGRDFETYRTYLHSSPIARSSFIGRASNKRIVFGCSLDKKIERKIKADLEIMFDGTSKPDEVHYFCEANLPIAKRKSLQDHCLSRFHVELEIHDGMALAESLSDRDVSWIALAHLSIPAEIVPVSGGVNDAYSVIRQRWIQRADACRNWADFFEIKSGLRAATFDEELRSDLSDWLKRIKEFDRETSPPALRQCARYEVCVGTLRGLGQLDSELQTVRDFFLHIPTNPSVDELRDATLLMSYCFSAKNIGHFHVLEEELYSNKQAIIEKLKVLTGKKMNAGVRCSAQDLLGTLDTCVLGGPEAVHSSVERMIDRYLKMIPIIKQAPLYPLESLTDRLTVIAPHFDGSQKFEVLTRRIDALFAARAGKFIVAEKCKDRALEFLKANKYIAAINELHRAKVYWFSDERIENSINSILLIGKCYSALKMEHAARYYAAAALQLCLMRQDEELRRLSILAAELLISSHYGAGEFITYFEAANVYLIALNSFGSEPWDLEKNEPLQRFLAHFAIIRVVAQRLAPDIAVRLDKLVEDWHCPKELLQSARELSEEKDSFWRTIPIDEVWKRLGADLCGIPFGDAGTHKTIEWNALGVSWRLTCLNEYNECIILDEIAAALQVFLVDLAKKDLFLLPMKIEVIVELNDCEKLDFREAANASANLCRIIVPRSWITRLWPMDVAEQYLRICIPLISMCSLLPESELRDVLGQSMRVDLASKLVVVKSAREIFLGYREKTIFYRSRRAEMSRPSPTTPFEVLPPDELRWNDSLAHTYSKKSAQEFLKNRYSILMRSTRFSVRQLVENTNGLRLISALKSGGKLDWQILSIVLHFIVNEKLNSSREELARLDKNKAMQTLRQRFYEEMHRDETESEHPIDFSKLTPELAEMLSGILAVSTLKTWKLKLRSATPDFRAIEKFLDVKFRHSLDDIPHEDPFYGRV